MVKKVASHAGDMGRLQIRRTSSRHSTFPVIFCNEGLASRAAKENKHTREDYRPSQKTQGIGPIGTCPGGTIEDVSPLREHTLGRIQEEEMQAEEKKRELDAVDREEMRECPGKDAPSCNKGEAQVNSNAEEERKRPGEGKDPHSRNKEETQADGNAEESSKEGAQERLNTEEINKPQFLDPAARHVPGGTWLAQDTSKRDQQENNVHRQLKKREERKERMKRKDQKKKRLKEGHKK
ncbi:hypothetical protein NDU88_002905 [Pleurodeles waltl]|uniref:Uncharacterized protein n=1 Tax=Pleurodeles waltl TaxID=8319 RepID=A0AAV7QB90_PLEWA|nr:hypothetical protein NDU88_002905 [Pleurodeles waltl]